MMEQLTIICVLKTGGDFDADYFQHITNSIKDKVGTPFHFCFITDLDTRNRSNAYIPLMKNYPGWWSKLEAFRIHGPCIYLDLDTVVLRSISNFAKIVCKQEKGFWMLEPFRATEEWASGVMAWNGDYRWLFNELTTDDILRYEWDQRYISAKLKERCVLINRVQEYVKVMSYKKQARHLKEVDADIVCFHGKPRPHEVRGEWWKA